jgi:penicillin-binding protein 1A
LVVVGLGVAAFGGARLLTSSCSLSQLRPLALSENSFLVTRNGSLLGTIPSVQNRQVLGLAEMSKWVPRATVAVEDRRFYQHGALDYQGIVRAAFADLATLSLSQGGSTITQQLVRTLYLGSEQRTLTRKLKEACLALRLQREWSKNRILTAYLNDVYYGGNAFGVEAAAQTYFSIPARSLDLPKAALLAGLPRAPSTFDPLQNPRLALNRRNQVLSAMLVAGSITRGNYNWAVSTPLGLKPGVLYTTVREPNFFGYVQDELVSRLGANRVRLGGLRVQTTLATGMQQLALNAIKGVLRDRRDPAAALVAIEPWTGAIRAMVSYVPNGERLQFNLASQAARQAGSSFKPFVLTTALEQGVSPYSSWPGPPELVITDPRCFTNGQPWDVHNYADEAAGTMNLFDATANSVNTIYAQISVEVGPQNVVTTAQRMGITSPLKPYCSITLGTQGVNALEMADAYATLAARGVHHDPESISSVKLTSGIPLTLPERAATRVIPQNVADVVTSALERVVQYGTGTAASYGRPIAGKTGTAENYDDAWFCGYTPQLATCVWIGYPHREQPLINIEGVPAVFGGSLPAQIWHNFMAAATQTMPKRDFPQGDPTAFTVYPQPAYSYPQTSTRTTTTTTTTPTPITTPTTTTPTTTTTTK